MNIFEQCCRSKLRFKTTKGNLTVEDLLDLSLQSLDRIGKTIKQEIRSTEDSLLEGNSDETVINRAEIKLNVVKHIILLKQRSNMVDNAIHKLLNIGDEEVL